MPPGNLYMRLQLRSIFTALSLFFILSSLAHAADSSPVISRIQESGTLVLGTSGSMPLMSEKLMTGELAGFDIDLANALAESMDVKLEIKTLPFQDLIPALESGKVDVVLSNMTITVERNMQVAFAGPYFVSGKCLITKEEEVAKSDSASDLNQEDMSIAVVKGTTSESFVKELLPELKRINVADVDEGTLKVERGEVKAMLTDFPICLSVMKRYPNSGFESVLSLLTYEPIGIALSADDPLFVNLAQNFIQRAEYLGVIDALKVKWFGNAVLTAIEEK
jgi:polar amino acid transport system substrate-binding protein